METQIEVSTQERLRDRASYTSGYISGFLSALEEQGVKLNDSKADELREHLSALARLCEKVTSISKEALEEQLEKSPNRLPLYFAVAEALRELLKIKGKIGHLWSDETERTLQFSAEYFEDAAETLMLGLNHTIRAEIAEARIEAGVDSYGKSLRSK